MVVKQPQRYAFLHHSKVYLGTTRSHVTNVKDVAAVTIPDEWRDALYIELTEEQARTLLSYKGQCLTDALINHPSWQPLPK